MTIVYVLHALKRMDYYKISEKTVELAIREPDSIADGQYGRTIYQRRLNGHILRVIVEEGAEIKRVITVYPSGKERYDL